jgi:hypothetical protein
VGQEKGEEMTATVTTIQMNETVSKNTNSHWITLYKLGGTAALLSVLVILTDIALTFFPAGAEQPGTMTAVDWFRLFQDNWFFGLRNLGLLPNILNLSLSIPIFIALYEAHKHTNRSYAALAVILSLIGTAIYLSNNAAFPMLALSTKYASATTDAQRALLTAAGEAILARGEDFTPGALIGFLFSEISMIVITLVMLRGGIFSRATAYTGLLGAFFLTIFTIWTTFIPWFFELVIIFALTGGLLTIAWSLLTARRLFQLGNH